MLVRIFFVLAALGIAPCFVDAGTYSRSAKTIPLMCDGRSCLQVVAVRSPDGVKEVRRTFKVGQKDGLTLPEMDLRTPNGQWDLPVSGSDLWVDVDVLWSPDSHFLALTGSMNGYTESMRIFAIKESGPKELNIIIQASHDMLLRFPRCRARYVPSRCNDGDDSFLNFAAVDWVDAHTIVLMSEVPCDSNWGGIMCQVMGYEVNVRNGSIVQMMTAREFKNKWQHSMPWKFRIPEPPEWTN